MNVILRLQDAITRVSDQRGIAVVTVPRDRLFQEALNVVSGWLVSARSAAPVPPSPPVANNGQNIIAVKQSEVLPGWKADTRTLKVGEWQKRYKANAKNQLAVLKAFHDADWKEIHFPLEYASLCATVRDLNDSLATNDSPALTVPIKFCANGNGTGIRWVRAESGVE